MSFPNMEPGRIDGARHVTEELSEERCWELLRSQDTGRFGFNYKNRVMILPVSYLVHDRAIYFRTSATGTIGDAVPRLSSSFEIDEARPDRSEGWSVLVSGPSSHVEEPELLTYLWGQVMEEPWAGGPRNDFIRIHAAVVTGRRVHLA
ncbi:pyridoxamine 5'-phosphate oxidase family protein [Arthrobacter sp. MI7-26]|uniref:pyridoxamine 5'-phosphate oxidase family protein n=1 Tax=Arthrobacter sp. MI7-26 TaxID=2993653 RepID=UPI0022497391|nr:pyridoxamine 5'-phosphate oxidase family protein [Arthrobacter sp. MI7-26]MCX2749624.1 pyridoxamine 5'-phosphate oxidase family protein [Arthrobacter sp. MI7-26]